MMRLLLAASFCLFADLTFAKALPHRAAEQPQKSVTACSYLGEGYVKAEGSDTCIKISGSIRAEGSISSGR